MTPTTPNPQSLFLSWLQKQRTSLQTMEESDIQTLKDVLGIDRATARHYLACFDYDRDRTVHAVVVDGVDYSWWAHPWNSATRDASISKMGGMEGYNGEEEGEHEYVPFNSSGSTLCEESEAEECKVDTVSRADERNEDIVSLADGCNNDTVSQTLLTQHEEQNVTSDFKPGTDLNQVFTQSHSATESVLDDRSFYRAFPSIVDDFIDQVCGKGTKSDLRNRIVEADNIVALETGMQIQECQLVNRLSYKHNKEEGRSPLSYAVAKNLYHQVYDLIDLGAEVSKVMKNETDDKLMGALPTTALVIAATNGRRDGTEMVRILLSKGASPEELTSANVDQAQLSRGMKYWIDKARRVGVPPKEELEHMAALSPMDRIHELDYGVVGQESAVSVIQEALAARFGNPQGSRGKPLVLLFLGPPGHGKTYFSSNAARSLVGEDNFLFVPCQSIRDDADLFGSRLGGSRSGEYSSDGQLTSWLRARQKKKVIVFLDEFEKMKDLTSSLGWGQAKKIYQSFLEPWQDGTLSDQGARAGGRHMASHSAGGQKIDCSQSIWILTSNWGQREIIDFCDKHKDRVQTKVEQKDVAWIQKELVKKILRPLCMREFASVHEDIKALCRRIDMIVPFLPFTKKERKVVADIAVTNRFSMYRDPCILNGSEDKRRSLGNLHLRSTRAFAAYAAECYDPMQGASGMLSAVQQADGKFQMLVLRNKLQLTDEQKARIKSEHPPDGGVDEPSFWVHFDKDAEEICITHSHPVDDDSCSESSSDGEAMTEDEGSVEDETSIGMIGDTTLSKGRKDSKITRGTCSAADDAF